MSVESEAARAADVDVEVAPRDLLRRTWDNLRSGELGAGPIIVALVIITLFFYFKDSTYVGSTNFNNVIVQMAGTTIIAFGVVFVLLLGEIDLSIGSVSGLAAVVAAELQLPDSGHQIPGLLAILAAIAAGAAIGAFQGSFVAFLGVPSFVVTLAGLLAWQGVLFKSLPQSVIIIQDSTINNVAGYFFSHLAGWIFAAAASALYAFMVLGGVVGRLRAGLRVPNLPLLIAKIVVVTAIAFFVAYKSNADPGRGVPFAGLLVLLLLIFWTFVATRTTFGRHVYAVGGNAEAARRAGINVARIRVLVFAISGAMAALGGIVFGGTSLFGGRGKVVSAVLGGLVIALIANGIDLVGYSAATKQITTGAILLAAVTLDTVARRRQEATGH
jgi:D-xylose transport system permease protein